MKKTALLLTAILAFTAVTLYAQDAKTRFDNGKKLVDQWALDGAIKELTEAIRLDPKFADAYYYRGFAYYFKDYDRAIADFTEAIRLDPKYALAYYYRGDSYYEKKDYDRAITDFTEAIKLDPKNADVYINRGVAYQEKKDYDRAIADFTEYIRLVPEHTAGYFNRGSAYQEKKDYDRAIADYEAGLRIAPNDSKAKNYLAEAKREAAKKNDSSQSTTGVISVTAKDLASAYDSNQLRADAQYKDKTVKITGKVTNVGNNAYGNYVELNDDVWVLIKSSELNKAMALDKGKTVTLSGTCIGRPGLMIQIKDSVFSN